MKYFDIIFWILAGCGLLALIFNVVLIFLIIFCTRSALGLYKWILIVFCVFECAYSLCIFLTTPIHLVTPNNWIVISSSSLLQNTPFYSYGPAAYCVFWYMWIFFIVFLFVYRYVIVCHQNFKMFIQTSSWMKLALFFIYAAQIAFSIMCGAVWCTRMPFDDGMKRNVNQTFGIDNFENMGYMTFGPRSFDGVFSMAGTWALLDHYVVLAVSAIIIIYCCFKIYGTLERHRKSSENVIDVKLQRQVFYTLLVQTIIPFLMYHLPTIIFLTFPFWPEGFQLGSTTPVFSVLTTIPKILDPIVTIVGIKDYRRAIKNILACRFSVALLNNPSSRT